MSGESFLALFPEGTGDTVTSLDPGTVYAVRQPTRHPVYEHFRVKAFAEMLHGTDCPSLMDANPLDSTMKGNLHRTSSEVLFDHGSFTLCMKIIASPRPHQPAG